MAGYARLSNGFWQDKDILKLRRMNPSAALLYVMAISWCSDHASDGIIADDELLYVLNASDGDVADLVASGLLLRGSDEGCYMIRNYLKYQNSSRQIDESRERERVKKRRQREARQDIANVPDVSPKDDANVPDVSPKDIANVPDVSPKDDANVPDVSPKDIANVPDVSPKDDANVPDTSFNQEPRTKNQEDISSYPPTPHEADFDRLLDRIEGFYPPNRFDGKTSRTRMQLEIDWPRIAKAAGDDDPATFLEARARAYCEATEPRYVKTFGRFISGELYTRQWVRQPEETKPRASPRSLERPAKSRSQENLEANMARTWAYMTPAERAEYQRRHGGDDNAQQG